MKKALVVTPTDGTKEVITHQQSGLIVDLANRKNWQNAIWLIFIIPNGKKITESQLCPPFRNVSIAGEYHSRLQKSTMTFSDDYLHSFVTSKHGQAFTHSSGSISPFPFRSGLKSRCPQMRQPG